VNKFGSHTARTVIESQIIYPRTTSLTDDKALALLDFEDTLTPVIADIQNNIESKACCCHIEDS